MSVSTKKDGSRKMVIGISFKRLMNTLLVASLFLGLTLALTTGVDARKRVETMTSAQCSSLYTSFIVIKDAD
jgi:hypothetical protein